MPKRKNRKKERKRNHVGGFNTPRDAEEENTAVIQAPTGDECPIQLLSDDLLTGILQSLSLADKFAQERVCRRWKRLMERAVWPRLECVCVGEVLLDPTTAQTPQSTSKGKRAKSPEQIASAVQAPFRSRIALLLARCWETMVELVLDANMGRIGIRSIVEHFQKRRDGSKHDDQPTMTPVLPSLRHLHIRNLRPARGDAVNEITQLLDAVTGDRHHILKSLSLEDIRLADCCDGNPGVGATATLPFGDYFGRFLELEALTVTAASPLGRPLAEIALTVGTLPSKLGYLALRMAGTSSVDTWLRVAARDCREHLATLRILPVVVVTDRNWEYSHAGGAPSPEALRLIAHFSRLRSLQLVLPAEDGSFVSVLTSFASRPATNGGPLQALSISNPSAAAILAVHEQCGPSLEHLSLADAKRLNDTRERGVRLLPSRLGFPKLRSLKLERVPYMVANGLLVEMEYPDLEWLHVANKAIGLNDLEFLLLQCGLKSLATIASPLGANARKLPDYLEKGRQATASTSRQESDTQRCEDAEGKHPTPAPFAYYPLSDVEQIDWTPEQLGPSVRVMTDAPVDRMLTATLLAALSDKS